MRLSYRFSWTIVLMLSVLFIFVLLFSPTGASNSFAQTCDSLVRIMPLGDSITQGRSSGVEDETLQIAYRKTLYDMLIAEGYTVDFVGSLVNGQAYAGFDPDHEGWSGKTDRYIRDRVEGYLDANPADIVLLHIGTNELNDSGTSDVEGILNNIDDWEAANHQVTVILALIINRVPFHQITADFNDNVAAMAQSRIAAGDDIIIVNMENGAGIIYNLWDDGGDMYDNLHPYATGYNKMAQVWYDALMTVLPPCSTDVTITTSPSIITFVNQPYTYDVNASGSPAPGYALLTFPGGMGINATSGVISWTPAATGEFFIEIEASNGDTTDTQSYTLKVVAPVQITTSPVTTGTTGQPYSYDVDATGNSTISYELVTAPAGMTIDDDTGLVNWAPTTSGSYPVTVRASDPYDSDEQSFTIVVDSAVEITSTPVTEVAMDAVYTYDVDATGSPAPTYELITAPSGMTIDAATGVINWTPTAAGTFPVTVRATNVNGINEQSFNVEVVNLGTCSALGYWQLNETASPTSFADSVNGNDATCSGAACPTPVTGIVDGAQSFDGTNDGLAVVVPNAATNTDLFDWTGSGSFSFETWVNIHPSNTCSGQQVFFGRYQGGGDTSVWLGCYNSYARFSLRSTAGGSSQVVETAAPINDGAWHHLVAVRDGSASQTRLYVDGVLSGSQDVTYTGNFYSSNNVTVGWYDSKYHFKGQLDEIAIYGHALTLTEIQAHYNGGSGAAYCDTPDIIPPVINLVGDNPLIWQAGVPYTDPGATATDNVDGDLSGSIVVDTSGLNINAPGDYTVAYLVTDESGNVSSVTRTISVFADNTPPVETANLGMTIDEGTEQTIDPAWLQYTDAEQTPGELVYTVTILPANGELRNGGAPLDASDTFTQQDINDGFLSYLHDGSEGTTSDSFEFDITDGIDPPLSGIFDITITEVNDPPVAEDDSATAQEGDTIQELDGGATSVLDNDSDAEFHNLTAQLVADVTNGTLTLNPDGSFEYVHNGGETTSDSFTYMAIDELGADSNVAEVTITIDPVNDAPVANDDTATVDEGDFVLIELTLNDIDVDSEIDEPTLVIQTLPLNGSLVNHGDGTVTYTHDGSETTGDSFTYTVNDVEGETSNEATVTITVTPQNDAPVANDDTATVDEGDFVIIDLTTNDADIDGTVDGTTIVFQTLPANGLVVDNDNGTVIYTHNDSDTTSDAFTYSVSDNNGAVSNIATVSITINPVNDPPDAVDDTATVTQGGSVIIDLTDNDTDDSGIEDTTVVFDTLPANGIVVDNDDGTVTYTHDGSATTSDSFTYTVDDIDGVTSDVATVSITIVENIPPIANDDSASVNEGGSVGIDLTDDDTDADGTIDDATIVIVAAPANGSLLDNGDGTVTYTHDGSETLSDTFTYTVDDDDGATSNIATVTITVNPVNDPPVAVDDNDSTPEDTPVTVNVVTNDNDVDGTVDPATVVVVDDPTNGTAVPDGSGGVLYTPDADFNGIDTFTYTVDDDGGATSNTATVTITVNPVNDGPTAVDDSATVDEGSSVGIDLTINDSDSDGTIDDTTLVIVSGPTSGSLLDNGDGTVTYTHDGSETTGDSFTYTVDDNGGATSNVATVTITVNPVNDAPVASDDGAFVNEGGSILIDLIDNDSDPEGTIDETSIIIASGPTNGSLTDHNDGTVTYTHDGSETLSDTFTYTVDDDDGATSNIATVTITVNPVNDPPVAVDDSDTTPEDTPLTVNVVGNDTDVDGSVVPATVAVVSSPANGTAVPDGSGGVLYTPDADFNGIDTFTYTVDDDGGATSNAATVTITVDPVNDAPVAVDDTGIVIQGGSTLIDLTVNDTDDGTIVDTTIVIVSGPTNGSLLDNGDGTVTYTHDGGVSTSDSFTYTVDDDSGTTSNIATVSITITGVNIPPVANDDSASVNEGGSVGIDLTDDDTDADGTIDDATIVIVAAPANGSLLDNGDGTVTYTHDGSETTSDTFTYTVNDDDGATSNIATVTITVNPVNDPPVAVDDSDTTSEDTPVTVIVVTNDTDIDGTVDAATVAVVSSPANGTAVPDGSGGVLYTPDADFNGIDTFTYTVDDDGGATSNAATVTITVDPVNDAPVAVDDTGTVSQGGSVIIDLTVNDTDDGTIVDTTLVIVSGPTNGSLVDNGDGTVTYTHDSGIATSDSFTYTVDDDSGTTSNIATVSITITGVNIPPVANDDSASVNEGGSVGIDLTDDDTDADGTIDDATIAIVAAPANGSLLDNGDGTVTYTHDGSETLSDTFTYTVDDDDGATSNAATVTITVNPVNDPPVTVDDNDTTSEDTPVTVIVTTNDSDVDGSVVPATVVVVSSPANGTAVPDGSGGVLYTPDADFNGIDTFTYTVDDDGGATSNAATVTITVDPVNDAPVAVDDTGTVSQGGSTLIDLTVNDTDVDGTIDDTSITIVAPPANGLLLDNGDGTVTYTHDGGVSTSDSFTYTVDDDGGATSNTATVTISVNMPPVANDDSASVNEGGSVGIDLTDDDTDADGTIDDATIVIVAAPANGSLLDNGDGTVTYTHDGSETLSDTFTYTVDDDDGATSNIATVTITVNPVNDPPVAVDDTGTLIQGGSTNIDLTINDTDVDGTIDETSITIVAPPANGSLLDNGDGTVTYTHDGSATTSDSFTYTVDDDGGATSNVATVTITITPLNVAPVAVDDTDTTPENTPVTVNVIGNDTDSDGTLDPASVVVVGAPANGTAVPDGTGGITYTPSANFSGTDTFTYTVNDDDGATSNVATVTITVTAVNDVPVASSDSAAVNEGGSVTINVIANDTDPDGTIDPASVAVVGQPTNGTAFANTDGTITYTHNGSETTADSFTYTVNDNGGATSNVATVTVTITPVNDPPVVTTNAGLSVNIGQAAAIGASQLAASDPDNSAVQLVYTIQTVPANGTLLLNNVAAVNFTQDDINNGRVSYQHNGGSGTNDSFTFVVSDGSAVTPAATFTITLGIGVSDIPINLNVQGDMNTYPLILNYQWTHMTSAGATQVPVQWYRLVVVKDGQIMVDTYISAADYCQGVVCIVPYLDKTPNFVAEPGTYSWWVQAVEGVDANGQTTGPWSNEAQFTIQPPVLPTQVTVDTTGPTVVWADSPAVAWVILYIGTADYSTTLYFDFFEPSAAQCDGTTCRFTPGINPGSGDYAVWAFFWNPQIPLSAYYDPGYWVGATFSLP